jgi:hypothetical protein
VVGAFRGDSQDAIHNAQIGGITNSGDSKKRSDGSEAGIPGTDLVVPPHFEVFQESQNGRRVQVSHGQASRGTPGSRLQEAKQQAESVTISKHGSGTRAPVLAQVLGEEILNERRKAGGGIHASPPAAAGAVKCWAAARSNSGVRVKYQ